MWFVSKNILEYFCRQDISDDKKNKAIDTYAVIIKKVISKMSTSEIIDYLFEKKVPKKLKNLICDCVNEITTHKDSECKAKAAELLELFKKKYGTSKGFIKLDHTPDIIKKYIIDTEYEKTKVTVVSDERSNKKIRKSILRLSFVSYEYAKVLKSGVSLEIEDYIIDECLNTSYSIANVIEASDLEDRIRDKVINRKVNKENVFEVIHYLRNTKYDKVVYNMKLRDIEDYINSLNYKTILNVLNSYYTPKLIFDYLFEYKMDLIEKAIRKASFREIETLVFRECNQRIVEMVVERKPRYIYSIIDKFYTFQYLSWIKLKYLPKEYKDYIINKHHKRLVKAIKEMKPYDVSDLLKKDSHVPEVVQELVFVICSDKILEYYEKEDDKEIIRSIRYGSLGFRLKRFLIEERINKDNVFMLLGEIFLDEETLRFTLELKKDLIKDYLLGLSNDNLFKFKDKRFNTEIVESMMESNQELIKDRLDQLSEEELYKYLDNENVRVTVKKLILEKYEVDSDDIENVLYLIGMYDTRLILDNYEEIREFINASGIDFNSFLQYGSGSKRHSKWFDRILEILYISEDIDDFIKCKNYLFDNYYDVYKENPIYEISSFLELLDSYASYKELFLDLENRRIILSKKDKGDLASVFVMENIREEYKPKVYENLSTYKKEIYDGFLVGINSDSISLDGLKKTFNNVLFNNAYSVLCNIGGTRAFRTLKKDNKDSKSVCDLIDELFVYSTIMEMVNDSNNIEGLKDILNYVFGDINILTKIQNCFSQFEKKVLKLYEMDSNNNLTRLSEVRGMEDVIDEEKQKLYGGEVFDFSNKNYCLYGHILSSKENIDDLINGISTGKSNFISVSPVSYRGQKYYWDRNEVIFAYDYVPNGNFVCSSISNMGSNSSISNNSSEVKNINRRQRGILETSAVVEQNAEALLFREGLKPCGLILPGGREPSKKEMDIHEKYGLPFIITQKLYESIDDPSYVFKNDLKFDVDIDYSDIQELRDILEILKISTIRVKEDDYYTGREIAVFADCHSMYEPTLAVLEDIRRNGIREIYSLGDNVGLGPNPSEVFDLLDEYRVISIAGNAEYYNTLGVEPFPYLVSDRLDNQLWTERKLGQERIMKLKIYPASIDLFLGDKKIALCHFANDIRWDFRDRSVHTYLASDGSAEQFMYTNSEEALSEITGAVSSSKVVSAVNGYMSARMDPIFGGKKVTDYDFIIQGHSHFEKDDELDNGISIITLRALGMGFTGDEVEDEACYYILRETKDGNVDIEKVYVKFNRNSLLSSIHTCDLPSKDRILSYVKKSR